MAEKFAQSPVDNTRSDVGTKTENTDLTLDKQRYSENPLKDRSADQYRNEYITEFVDKWDSLIDWDARSEAEADFFVNVLSSRGRRTVLDVATGTGYHSVQLIKAGFDVSSADGSAAMLVRAFENGRERGLILKTIQADWRWLGRSVENRFDAIVCLGNSFTHLHDELDRRRALAEFYAALKPDGVLIIDQRNYDSIIDNGFSSKHKYYYCGDQVSAEPEHISEELVRFKYSFPDGSTYNLNLHPIRKNYFRRLLREAGFERIRTYGDFRAAYRDDDSDFFVHVVEKSTLAPKFPMTQNLSSRAKAVTEDYYNSDDADAFYSTIWGGEDLHLGIYENTSDIREAGFAIVDKMAEMLPGLGPDSYVIDLGAGYGGSARRIAAKYDCRVMCLNLSETQNDRNLLMTQKANLARKIEVRHGDFEDVPAANDTFSIVWSQDSFLHSSARDRILAEAFRILKPGGYLIFTDPMESPLSPPEVLTPIYERLYLNSLGSFDYYEQLGDLVGFEKVNFVDLSEHLSVHYSHIRDELLSRRDHVGESASEEYIDRMLVGLENWIEGGKSGYLHWGIMLFQKPLM